MGCDSKLYLPASTQLDDFADVLALLLGAQPQMVQGVGYTSCEVPHGFSWVVNSSIPEMLVLQGSANGHEVYAHWHWEGFSSPIVGARLFSCSTREERRPALVALADFFGGILDFNDCDGIAADAIGTLTDKPYRPDATDAEAWAAWQQAKMDLAGSAYAW